MNKIKEIIKYLFRGEVPTWKFKKRGMVIGENFQKQDQVIIDYWHCHLITIGNNVTLAPRVYILAHDASTKNEIGYSKIGKVKIGDNVFIGAGSIILPNVRIGNNVIIGAGSVISKNVESNSVVTGNPQKVIRKYDEYICFNQKRISEVKVFDKSWTGNLTANKINEMNSSLDEEIGYLE